jgi:hypothetical protein
MTNLEKLDNAIKELEEQSNDLKEYNKVYSEIVKLKSNISDNLKILKENNAGFEALSTTIQNKLEQSKKGLETLESELLHKIQELIQDNKGFQKKIDESILSQLGNMETGLLKKIQELYLDNKSFQKELDSSIISRLEKNKSDVQVEIRNEGIQIQRSFENTLNLNFNTMESKFKEQFDQQLKELKFVKTVMLTLILLVIGLAFALFLK